MGQKTYQYAAIFEFATREDLAAYFSPIRSTTTSRHFLGPFREATLIADVELFDPSSSDADKLGLEVV